MRAAAGRRSPATCSRARDVPRAAALYAGAGAIAALLWLLAADLIWSGLSPNPFQIFGWWDALVLWGHDWLTTAYLAASAALPAAILILGVDLMFRSAERRRGRQPPGRRP